MTVTHTPGAKRHARYSPSSFSSREKCPGWSPDNDPSKSSLAADRGTLIHEAIEKEDTSLLVAEDDVACANKCLAYVEKLADNLIANYPAKVERFKEIQLKVLDQFGTADDLMIAGGSAELVDYKTGYWEVPDAEVNAQMQGYVLGVFDQFPNVQNIRVHLLMPRQNQISTAIYTRAEHYKALKLRTFMTIESSKAADRMFQQGELEKLTTVLNPAPDNCEFCGRKAECPALTQLALTVAKRYEPALMIPDDLHGSAITDPTTMSRALLVAPILEKWAAGVKNAALTMRMEQGVEIPGFILCERKGSRKITDAQAAWETVKDVISPEEFAGCADVSMPDLEKAVAAKAPRGAKEAAKQQLEDRLRDRSALTNASTVHYLKQQRK